MRYTYFKELTSKILSIVIGILFILLVGTTNIPMQASAEVFLLDDNVGKISIQNEIFNEIDPSCYSVENVVNELFEESTIKQCK